MWETPFFQSLTAKFPWAYSQTSLAARTFGTALTISWCVQYDNCMLLELRHWTNWQSNIWYERARKDWKNRARYLCVWTKFTLALTYDINCTTTKFLAKEIHTKFTPKSVLSKTQTQVYLVEISFFGSGFRQAVWKWNSWEFSFWFISHKVHESAYFLPYLCSNLN